MLKEEKLLKELIKNGRTLEIILEFLAGHY